MSDHITFTGAKHLNAIPVLADSLSSKSLKCMRLLFKNKFNKNWFLKMKLSGTNKKRQYFMQKMSFCAFSVVFLLVINTET
jgi:hypothetical protein